MQSDVLTSEQYRNAGRLANYRARLSRDFDALDHAIRTRRGMRVLARLYRLIRRNRGAGRSATH